MRRLLVAGGAGFIGSNFIRHVMRERPDVEVLNFDALTYAGNLENLVEVQPLLALAGVSLRPRPWWHWAIVAGAGILIVGGGLIWLRARKPIHASEKPRYTLPEPATAFSLIALLRRMEADPSLSFKPSDRAELDESIRRLEAHYFSRQRNGHGEPDLTSIGRRWVALASNGKS